MGVTDFLYDIENDEQLNFEVKNLSIQPYTTTTTKTTIINDKKTTDKINPFKKIIEITTSALTNSNNTTNNNKTTENNTTANNTNTNNNTTNNETNNKTIIYDPEWVEVTFKVENVGITLD